jgi:hypothetical protein
MEWVVGESRQSVQNSAGPMHQMSRMVTKARRDPAHDGPAICDHNDPEKQSTYEILDVLR